MATITINNIDGLTAFLQALFGGIDEATLLTHNQHNVPQFDVIDPVSGLSVVDTAIHSTLRTNTVNAPSYEFLWLQWPGGGFIFDATHGPFLNLSDSNQVSRPFPFQLQVSSGWTGETAFGGASASGDPYVKTIL